MGERLVAPWNQSKYLVGTSLLFLGPASYAYTNNMPLLATTLTITSLVSANFWRHANYSIRRNCDLVVAKGAMAIMCYNGAHYIRTFSKAATAYPCLGLVTYTYYKSHELHNAKNNGWLSYHMTMHALLTYEEFAILSSINESGVNGVNSQRDTVLIMLLMSVYFISLAQYFKYHSLS
jgi:hypothetical protein